MTKQLAHFHLPGAFEFYDFYKAFLPLYHNHPDWFYPWCTIDSIYGAPAGCIWGGGRVGFGEDDPQQVLSLLQQYGISVRLTFSNSLLQQAHLSDKQCNSLCAMLNKSSHPQNGVILHSDLLLQHLQNTYPHLYFVSSTTKVLINFARFHEEVQRPEFRFVVPDFRLNKQFSNLSTLTPQEKAKVEFLCNECCFFGCKDRKACYENVSRKSLGENCPDHICTAPHAREGYRFSRAMENPSFISINDIRETYLPMGFSHFIIEGRSLGSAVLLEFLLHYLTKPAFHLRLREELYLDSTLDLF